MPTYSYECDACGHTLDKFQGINDDPLTKCPKCNKKKLRRLFGTGGGLIFKGSGFYLTDYRSESYKSSAEADKKSSESSSNSTAKSDSGEKSSSKGAEKTASDKPAAEKPAGEKPARSEGSSKKKGKE